ncbi:MAG: response regulator, partial [Planctomycetota bacterium]
LVPRIFEPFFTTKSMDQGSGLGLATVHGIVEEHGAQIEVHSSIGEGTTFVIEFERIAEQQSSAGEVPEAGSREGAGESILLAEDNDQIRQIVAATLESGGYEVVAVPDGEALAEALQREGARFKLLLMDVDLPRRSGMDVLAEIRSTGDETPALVMTANTEVALPPGEEDHSRTTILLKPFKMSELMNRVGALMQPAD